MEPQEIKTICHCGENKGTVIASSVYWVCPFCGIKNWIGENKGKFVHRWNNPNLTGDLNKICGEEILD